MRMPPLLAASDARGQVLVEYILMLLIAVTLLVAVQTSFRKSLFKVWTQLAKEISAGCPKAAPAGCIPDPNIH